MEKPAPADPYLDLIVTYCIYAKSLWREADEDLPLDPQPGGYWGGGINELNQDGGVRGMSNTALGYALLVQAIDWNWLNGELLQRLSAAGMDRAVLLHYVERALHYLAVHHTSANSLLRPTWGCSWQSPLWTGAWGPAALLVWNDLPQKLCQALAQIAAAEADRITHKPPKDYHPGQSGAQDNGHDTHAPAVALAMDPENSRAHLWMRALQRYAANTYSVRADRSSTGRIGSDINQVVSTANLLDDFTLENHGILHVDYLQVSGQYLGEAWLCLQLGDQLHGTHLADEFQPYALHHAREVWEQVTKPLLLPTGEFTFPNWTEWTINCSMTPGYLAFIATALGDPVAMRALYAHPTQALRHRQHAPPGRILADSNTEWWWEPILVKRSCTALLQLALRTYPPAAPESALLAAQERLLPDSKVWIYRNGSYFASATWGQRKMGTFTPLLAASDNSYLTLPTCPGILPSDVGDLMVQQKQGDAHIAVLESPQHRRTVAVCLPFSVLWLSADTAEPLGIECDLFSGPPTLYFSDSSRTIPVLKGVDPFAIPEPSVNINNQFSLITTRDGFRYIHATDFNRRSAAIDTIVPLSSWGVWQMVPHTRTDQTWHIARVFEASFDGENSSVTLQDGEKGHRYQIRAMLIPPSTQIGEPGVAIKRLD